MLKAKHPALKGYVVLAISGKQTGIGSGAKEILGDLAALIVDDAAKAAFRQHLNSPPPKEAGEKVKKEWDERCEELVAELHYDGGVRFELRFDNLDYSLIARLQSDELVDREITPQTRASIHIVLGVRTVAVTPVEGRQLVRHVTGWPDLPENPKPRERAEQQKLDADLESRPYGYFSDLGANAYAAFNTMTDIASRPPQSPLFRRDRSSLERRAGAWLRDFSAAFRTGFSLASHLEYRTVCRSSACS